jgi:hypothetical protein
MAIMPKNRKIGTLVLVVLLGLIIGAYLNQFIGMLLPEGNVIRTLFTSSIRFGVGDFVNNKPLLVDLSAIRLQLGFQLELSALSILGIALSLYFFRWYD